MGFMIVNWKEGSSDGHERAMLNILMDSNLYFELPLQERHILLKHIVESYRSLAMPTPGNYPEHRTWT